MKFQTILLFAAAASFVFANGLEVSEDEDIVDTTSTEGLPAEGLPADIPVLAGDNNDAGMDYNDAGIESDIDDTLDNTPADEPIDTAVNIPAGEPIDGYSNIPASEPIDGYSNIPAGEPIDGYSNIPAGEPIDAYGNIPADESIGAADNIPAADYAPVDAAAAETPAEAGDSNPADAADIAEASDDYGDNTTEANVDSLDAADVADVADVTVDGDEAVNVDDLDAEDAENAEDSAVEDDYSSDSTLAAAGIAGAAALSSAGIFLWIKKSKKETFENSPLNMA